MTSVRQKGALTSGGSCAQQETQNSATSMRTHIGPIIGASLLLVLEMSSDHSRPCELSKTIDVSNPVQIKAEQFRCFLIFDRLIKDRFQRAHSIPNFAFRKQRGFKSRSYQRNHLIPHPVCLD